MSASKRLTPSGKRKLARLIRSTRYQLGLNQTQFGQLLGIGQRAISNWELGKGLSAVVPGMLLQRLIDRQLSTDTTVHRLRDANKRLNAQIRSRGRTPKSEMTQ